MPSAAAFSVPGRDWVEPPDDRCPHCGESHALYRDEYEDICCLYCGWVKPPAGLMAYLPRWRGPHRKRGTDA